MFFVKRFRSARYTVGFEGNFDQTSGETFFNKMSLYCTEQWLIGTSNIIGPTRKVHGVMGGVRRVNPASLSHHCR